MGRFSYLHYIPSNATSNEKKYVKKQNTRAKGNGKNVLSLPMPPRMRALKENATIATSLGLRRQIARS